MTDSLPTSFSSSSIMVVFTFLLLSGLLPLFTLLCFLPLPAFFKFATRSIWTCVTDFTFATASVSFIISANGPAFTAESLDVDSISTSIFPFEFSRNVADRKVPLPVFLSNGGKDFPAFRNDLLITFKASFALSDCNIHPFGDVTSIITSCDFGGRKPIFEPPFSTLLSIPKAKVILFRNFVGKFVFNPTVFSTKAFAASIPNLPFFAKDSTTIVRFRSNCLSYFTSCHEQPPHVAKCAQNGC
mmetsp:Transcript_3150/g.9734  ORF Transcript_3150/g.9734 Transcript_3150/m.9734 type:complete len:243 (+) Transcript_3150:797-1525(+)